MIEREAMITCRIRRKVRTLKMTRKAMKIVMMTCLLVPVDV